MSNIEQLIKKSLENPNYLTYWLEAMIDEQISDVKNALNEPFLGINNPHIIQELQDILKDIHSQPHWLKPVFENVFGIETKTYSKKKLSILLDQVETDSYKMDREYERIKINRQKIAKLLEDLAQLHLEFSSSQNHDFFLNEIDDKIAFLESYNITLLFNEKSLLEIKTLYHDIKGKG
ncbi:MAG: hypothetical protein U9R27_01280 [Campylobacterota bacterium]|nr:hypothetical protein [Campylobacterota bacterium]